MTVIIGCLLFSGINLPQSIPQDPGQFRLVSLLGVLSFAVPASLPFDLAFVFWLYLYPSYRLYLPSPISFLKNFQLLHIIPISLEYKHYSIIGTKESKLKYIFKINVRL